MGFAIRSRASRRPHSYPYYHCNILDITFKMESSVKHLQLSFGGKRNNRSTCHLFSQDTNITSRSVSNRSTSTSCSKLGVLSLLKVAVRWFFAHHSMGWWLSLICHVCFVSLWFAVRLCVIQLYAHALCQQNHCYRYCRSPRTEYLPRLRWCVCASRATFLMKDKHFHFPDFLTIKLN